VVKSRDTTITKGTSALNNIQKVSANPNAQDATMLYAQNGAKTSAEPTRPFPPFTLALRIYKASVFCTDYVTWPAQPA